MRLLAAQQDTDTNEKVLTFSNVLMSVRNKRLSHAKNEKSELPCSNIKNSKTEDVCDVVFLNINLDVGNTRRLIP